MAFEIFRRKVAVVTGAASGLGKGFCTRMAASGATIVAADIDLEGAELTAQEIERDGGKAEALCVDVTQYSQVHQMIEGAAERHSRVDYVFNNAGVAVHGQLEDIPIDNWEKVLALNLNGVVYGTEVAYKLMCEQGGGHIVNTASLAGLAPSPLMVPYCTTKFAVVGMCEAMQLEAIHRNIKVTALCPGFVDSGILEAALNSGDINPQQMKEQIPVIVDTEKGVDLMLSGVAKGKRIVTLPAYAHVVWGSHRFTPWLSVRIGRRVAKRVVNRGR